MKSNTQGGAAVAAAPALTSSELERARLFFEQTKAGITGAAKGVSSAQWNFKPAPDRWSIAENLEHVVLVLERILGPIREQLAQAPAFAAADRPVIDDLVIHNFPTRLQKFSSPDSVRPSGRWTLSQALDRLDKGYAELVQYIGSTPDLRERVVEAAPLRAVSQGKYETMDGYQWALAAAAHTERHAKQILEVKADPGFPA